MGLLQYTSNEMFSSTELVRKNKNIFDKLNTNEIEKAIILRDGKPSIILLDFNEYEKIITDYLALKNKTDKSLPIKINKANELENKNEMMKEKNSDKENRINETDDFDFSFDSESAVENKTEPLKEFWD